jgi:hypothetical protein
VYLRELSNSSSSALNTLRPLKLAKQFFDCGFDAGEGFGSAGEGVGSGYGDGERYARPPSALKKLVRFLTTALGLQRRCSVLPTAIKLILIGVERTSAAKGFEEGSEFGGCARW